MGALGAVIGTIPFSVGAPRPACRLRSAGGLGPTLAMIESLLDNDDCIY